MIFSMIFRVGQGPPVTPHLPRKLWKSKCFQWFRGWAGAPIPPPIKKPWRSICFQWFGGLGGFRNWRWWKHKINYVLPNWWRFPSFWDISRVTACNVGDNTQPHPKKHFAKVAPNQVCYQDLSKWWIPLSVDFIGSVSQHVSHGVSMVLPRKASKSSATHLRCWASIAIVNYGTWWVVPSKTYRNMYT